MKKITSSGIYTITEAAYHADPVKTPSLTSSVAKTIIHNSPLHAWYDHPRLGGTYDNNSNRNMDLGSAIHDAILLGMSKIEVIPYDNFRTAAAREMKVSAYENDLIPLLEKDVEVVNTISEKHHKHFKSMACEKVNVWNERIEGNEIWCRARIDAVDYEDSLIIDLKTTALSVAEWKRMRYTEYLMQVGMYRRALRNMGKHPTEYQFIFAVLENYEPYEMKWFELDELIVNIADKMAEAACRIWSKLDLTDVSDWPGYSTLPHQIECPGWLIDKYHNIIDQVLDYGS